jgi:predicted ArsR family transcriptional regulator
VRLALYRCVAGREQGLGRDEAAAAVGMSRKLAAYHLDKLAEAGLLDTRFERRSGRSGPGAGRPAKIYQRSARPLEVAVPARNYQLIAELLADAVRADPSGAARAALERAARAAGTENAVHADEDHSRPRDAAGVHAVLARHGYEPYDDEGVTRLRNCPFQRLAQTHRELVCRANLAFVEGLVQGLTARGLRVVLDPRPGRCCVALS